MLRTSSSSLSVARQRNTFVFGDVKMRGMTMRLWESAKCHGPTVGRQQASAEHSPLLLRALTVAAAEERERKVDP